jgi:hypothetical protein
MCGSEEVSKEGGFMDQTFSRIKKLGHADTVLYEIYMLRLAAARLLQGTWIDSMDAWVYLEDFLLHFRNLIEFLGKQENIRDGDVLVTTIWKLLSLKEPTNLKEVSAAGNKLLKKYEPGDKDGGGRISQYLQHCTEKRIDPKDWPISQMMDEIEPLLVDVEKHLEPGRNPDLKPVSPVKFLTAHFASTAVYTPTAAAVIAPKTLK